MNRPDKAGRARSLRAVGVSATIVAAALLTAGCGGSADASAPRDDRGDLTQLIYRFYNDMEYGQFDKLNTVLTDDVVVTNAGGKTQGRDKVIAQSAEAAKTEGRTYHLVSNVLVDLDGDRPELPAPNHFFPPLNHPAASKIAISSRRRPPRA